MVTNSKFWLPNSSEMWSSDTICSCLPSHYSFVLMPIQTEACHTWKMNLQKRRKSRSNLEFSHSPRFQKVKSSFKEQPSESDDFLLLHIVLQRVISETKVSSHILFKKQVTWAETLSKDLSPPYANICFQRIWSLTYAFKENWWGALAQELQPLKITKAVCASDKGGCQKFSSLCKLFTTQSGPPQQNRLPQTESN